MPTRTDVPGTLAVTRSAAAAAATHVDWGANLEPELPGRGALGRCHLAPDMCLNSMLE